MVVLTGPIELVNNCPNKSSLYCSQRRVRHGIQAASHLPCPVLSVDREKARVRQDLAIPLDRVQVVTPLRYVGGKTWGGVLGRPAVIRDQQPPPRLQHLVEAAPQWD